MQGRRGAASRSAGGGDPYPSPLYALALRSVSLVSSRALTTEVEVLCRVRARALT